MNWDSENTKKYYGENLDKAKRNYDKELVKTKTEFMAKYPFANVNEFELWVNLAQDDTVANETDNVYKTDGKTKLYDNTFTRWNWSWNVKSGVFRTKYADTLHWGPKMLEPKGTVQTFSLSTGVLPYNV